LHAERAADPARARALAHLGEWQSRRLRATYADLADDPRYAAAIEFFQNDLYGGGDFSRRDTDLARVVPMLVLALPETVIATIAQAMELNALSHELDRGLLARLPRSGAAFTVAEYCIAYRDERDYPRRLRQLALIGEVGAALDRYVRVPMLRFALAAMRQPARLAGFGALQDFLERGFTAFHRMRGATEFLATIDARESRIYAAIVGGSNDPFPDPWPRSAA
jgi:hypothetical protein